MAASSCSAPPGAAGAGSSPALPPPTNYVEYKLGSTSFIIHGRYADLKPIGRGAYGLVASATDGATGKRVAIKKVTRVFGDLTDAKRIMREVKLLRHFAAAGAPHENIIGECP